MPPAWSARASAGRIGPQGQRQCPLGPVPDPLYHEDCHTIAVAHTRGWAGARADKGATDDRPDPSTTPDRPPTPWERATPHPPGPSTSSAAACGRHRAAAGPPPPWTTDRRGGSAARRRGPSCQPASARKPCLCQQDGSEFGARRAQLHSRRQRADAAENTPFVLCRDRPLLGPRHLNYKCSVMRAG